MLWKHFIVINANGRFPQQPINKFNFPLPFSKFQNEEMSLRDFDISKVVMEK